MEPTFALIDDSAEAIARLTPLGREVMAPSVNAVRTAVLDFATRSAWRVLRYEEFVRWSLGLMRDETNWLILDPLFPTESLQGRARVVRLTRVFTASGPRIDPTSYRIVGDDTITDSVGILDDASMSGGRTV